MGQFSQSIGIDVTRGDSYDTMHNMSSCQTPEPVFGLVLISERPGNGIGPSLNVFHYIEADQYSAYLRALGRLQRAANGDLLIYVKQSYSIFENSVDQIRDHIAKIAPSMPTAASSWYIHISCNVLTFCSALHLYQEQTLEEVKRTYGDTSSELASAKQMFSSAYDGSLSYRLLYRLRNVLVHHSLGCVGFNISSKEDRSPAGLLVHKHTVHVPLKREVFLSAKKGVSATIRRELLRLDADPDLVTLSAEAMTALERLHGDVSTLVRPSLQEDAKLVCELDSLFAAQPGSRALVKLDKWPPDFPAQLPLSPISPELFQYAKEISATEP